MIWEVSEISYFRMFVFLGEIMTVVFGLLSAFFRGLSYVTVYVGPPPMEGTVSPVVYFWNFSFQIHGFTFGMLVSTIGGFLGVISSIKHYNELVSIGFAGSFLGVLGFLFRPYEYFYSPFTGEYRITVLWVGPCLTLLSISLMLVGLVTRFKGWHYLTLLGIILLLVGQLTYPLWIISNNLSLFLIRNLVSMSVWVGLSTIIGFALTLSGSAIDTWKFREDLRQALCAHK